ncbi:MAG TPA: peptide chain release factor N(5)-glutamine methyltransferase [Xanthobacteraceae bacterium]|jgi:release factor glutamine methyltransferase
MTVDGICVGDRGLRIEPGHSVEAARRRLAREFRRCGLDTPELDARILVGHALGLDHAALVARSGRALAAEEAHALAGFAARRLAREPVARIVGCKEFWGLPFGLNSETLLPRPETETVVEAALAAVRDRNRTPLHIADLGTGSGALLLALLSELPHAHGIGSDISPAALACARDNAVALGLAERAAFVACDYGAAFKGPVDLLVSNPPYVAHADIAALQAEVRDFDPARALDGGPDGLDGYRAIAPQARRLLAPAGVCVLELGFGQLAAVRRIFAAAGLAPVAERHDLSGVPRALVVQALP